jgi:hypothetical protein
MAKRPKIDPAVMAVQRAGRIKMQLCLGEQIRDYSKLGLSTSAAEVLARADMAAVSTAPKDWRIGIALTLYRDPRGEHPKLKGNKYGVAKFMHEMGAWPTFDSAKQALRRALERMGDN